MQITVERFYNYIGSIDRYSEHTRQSYLNDLDSFAAFLAITYQINDIRSVSHIHVRAWIVSLMDQKLSTRSINRKISALSTFFKYCRRFNEVAGDPMKKVVRPKQQKRLPVAVPKVGMEGLGLDDETTEDTPYKEALTSLIIKMLYSTGLRRAELIGLRDTDIDTSRQVLKVFGKGKKERLVPVNRDLLQEISMYQKIRNNRFPESDNNFLLLTQNGKPLYPKLVYNIVRSVLSHVPNLERKSPHILRHTFATHLSNAGADINAIKMLLGHASLSATQVYMHNAPNRLKAIYEQAHPRSNIDD